MPSKFIFFFMINIVTMVSTVQMADAQLGNLIPPLVRDPIILSPLILGLTNITGLVSCSVNGTTIGAVNDVPPFPNATVQLQCEPGNVLASTTTNNRGSFTILVNETTIDSVDNLLNNCNIVVITPLSSCNSSLPSTMVASRLRQIPQIPQQTGLVLPRILNLVNLEPAGFQFLPGQI